jgi:hypothetical protein
MAKSGRLFPASSADGNLFDRAFRQLFLKIKAFPAGGPLIAFNGGKRSRKRSATK